MSKKEADFIDSEDDLLDPVVLANLESKERDSKELSAAKVRQLLARRREAYKRVFTKGNRDQADIDIVLADLMRFCRAFASTYERGDGADAGDLMKFKEGRREVFLRIKDFSCLDEDTLMLKYTDATFKQ